MASVVIPNKPIILTRTRERRKIYTVHHQECVFTIQKNGTSIVSFRKKSDASRFCKLIECHHQLTKEWPTIDFENDIVYNTMNIKNTNLQYLDIKEWTEIELKTFCIEYAFNMLDIVKFEDDRKLCGHSIVWDVPISMYIDSLNKRASQEYGQNY